MRHNCSIILTIKLVFICGCFSAFFWKTSATTEQNKFSVHLVVAHYSESVAWVHNVTHIPNKNKFVYQKKHPDGKHYLPNKGNECLAYLTHIVEHYNSTLADYSIFLHDKPDKHCKNYLDYVNSVPLYATKQDALNFKPRQHVAITDLQQNHTTALKIHIPEVYKYAKKWLNYTIPESGTSIWSNGQFIVSKELIQKRPFTFWNMLLADLLSNDGIHGDNTGVYICGYLEQLWNLIWFQSPITNGINRVYLEGRGEHQVCT